MNLILTLVHYLKHFILRIKGRPKKFLDVTSINTKLERPGTLRGTWFALQIEYRSALDGHHQKVNGYQQQCTMHIFPFDQGMKSYSLFDSHLTIYSTNCTPKEIHA